MADPNPQSHWDLLLTDLGATPPAQADEPRPASPSPPQRAFSQKSPPKAKRPAAPPSPASWDALAGQLGLAPPPAPPAAKPVTPPPLPPPVATAPRQDRPARPPERSTRPPERPARQPEQPAAKQDRPSLPPSAMAEDSPNFYDEKFDFEEPFDILESSDAAPATGPEGEASEAEETREKRPRRRRRRRRSGRGDSERRDSAQTPATPTADSAGLVSAVVATEGGVVEEADLEEERADDERQSRHRRSRRGNRRRPGDESRAGAGESRPGGPKGQSDDENDEDLLKKDLAAVEGEEPLEGDELEGDQPARLGFRGIPTWGEAVGMLVTRNLEARAKRPGGGGPNRGRGNRNSRDNRGGRGRGDGKRQS